MVKIFHKGGIMSFRILADWTFNLQIVSKNCKTTYVYKGGDGEYRRSTSGIVIFLDLSDFGDFQQLQGSLVLQ